MRSRDLKYFLKYLGYGLAIGILIASMFLAGFLFAPPLRPYLPESIKQSGLLATDTSLASSASSPLPINTFTPTSMTPPSSTPMPDSTATLTTTELMLASGDIFISGPLTREQQVRLYDASLAFIAPTAKQSRQLSSLINLSPYSDPSSTCGPLAIAILQRADILSEDLVPHDFFLLNPDLGRDRQILKATFPKDSYNDTRYKIRLNKFDWASDPLMPGDFVYIYSGTQGNFEHMLVVNRVDYKGRAYSVTNYNTDQGFIINEVMLYDPSDPTVGIFEQWSKREKQALGSTGFAGFEVWRLKDNQ